MSSNDTSVIFMLILSITIFVRPPSGPHHTMKHLRLSQQVARIYCVNLIVALMKATYRGSGQYLLCMLGYFLSGCCTTQVLIII